MKSLSTVALTVFFMFLVSATTSAFAIGIAPGRIVIDYEPGYNRTFLYYIRGGSPGVPIVMTTRCDLSEYIKPSIDKILLEPGEIRYFSVTVDLPDEIEKPGRHECEVTAVEQPEGEDGGITAISAVTSQVWINVPYPTKYLEASLSAPNVNLSEPVHFNIGLISRGLENVTTRGIIKVSDVSGKNLATLYTAEKFVESLQRENLEAVWDTQGLPPGSYHADATMEYGGDKPALSSANFKIGDVLLLITNITHPDEISPGDIVKFEIYIDSYWNQEITDAFVNLEVLKDGSVVGVSKSESFDIEPWKSRIIPIFWDTGKLEEGEYGAGFTAHYEGRTSEKSINVEIKSPQNPYLLLIIIAAIVIALVIAGIIYYKKKKKK